MAPAARPSPHRFLPPTASATRQKSPTKQANPTTRPQTAAQDVDPDLLPAQPVQVQPPKPMAPPPPRPATARYVAPREAQAVSPSQFVPPPRFSTRRPVPKRVAPSSPPRLPFAIPRVRGEDVDEAPPDSDDGMHTRHSGHDDDDEEMLLDGYESPSIDFGAHDTDVLPTIEPTAQHETTLPFSPAKRRRLSPPARSSFPSTNTPSFNTPSLAPSAAPSTRPAFIPPPTPTAADDPAIPPLFSPHRRGAKFLPGGLAATVQSWVVETGQQAAASRRAVGRYGEVEGEMVVKVREVEGSGEGQGGVVRVRGTREGFRVEGEEVRGLLVGGDERGKVEVGAVVRVRMPWWQVMIEGQAWVVGIEWKVE
ncbi:hypothetical protein B0A48_17252 [Cryoendolithus antarcticus]|uniref:Uncharacterized protein n=1 Tax=Cryoendolithus antarcticus TaxID=1507870 RepID=A0A1V8SDD5_9PEZI|nr:hypothetical protein B0A48_17252 [Cryoendolithus antarcticus]